MLPKTALRAASLVAIALAVSHLSFPALVDAQSNVTMLDFSASSEMEDYLRVMQIAGKVTLYPWSIRGFSRPEITRLATADSTGPWKLRERFTRAPVTLGLIRLGAIYN